MTPETNAAEKELKAAFPDPTLFITIFDTIVGLISNCKNKDPKDIRNQTNTAFAKALIRNQLRRAKYNGNVLQAADKVIQLAQNSKNAEPFIEECLRYDLY